MNASNNSPVSVGATYLVEHIRAGKVIASETVHNIVPIEGLNHILSAVFKQGTQAAAWYVGVFEGNYSPVPGDTAATFPTAAVECVTYAPSTRPVVTFGTVAAGAVDNVASRAEITATAAKTLYGAFVTPAAAKGGVTGPLISAVRFTNPKVMAIDDALRITVAFEATSI